MSPPKRHTNGRSSRSTSNTRSAGVPDTKRPGTMYPYDATPALMRAFEQLKSNDVESSDTSRSSSPALLSSSAIGKESIMHRGIPGIDRTSSATFPPSSAIRGGSMNDHRLDLEHSTIDLFSSRSAAELKNFFGRDGLDTPPLTIHGKLRSLRGMIRSTTVVSTLFSAYGRMGTIPGSTTPCDKPLPPSPSCPDLEVYKRHESNGRLMVCEAREQHCSTTVGHFMGEQTGLWGIEELKAELLRVLGHLGKRGKERAKADLKVVTGNMLERIVAWDLNQAEALEQADVPLLSTIPTAESLNKVDAIYILKMFRSGMKKMPSDDVRYMIGKLPDEDLMALLHFTLLVSRPVLVWELDLDEI